MSKKTVKPEQRNGESKHAVRIRESIWWKIVANAAANKKRPTEYLNDHLAISLR